MRRGSSSNDPASGFADRINGHPNHLRCIFCGHEMWGGLSRLKHHLGQARIDVLPCSKCPMEVTSQFREEMVHKLLDGSGSVTKKRQRDESSSSSSMPEGSTSAGRHQPAEEEMPSGDVQESDLIKEAIEASMETYDQERKNAKQREDDFEAACAASMRSFKEEQSRRADSIDVYSDSDEEFGF